jgi:hypothetical protein
LIALDLSIDEFMKPLTYSHDKTRLMQIPDLELWFKSKAVKSSVAQRKIIYLAMFLISFGCALFYAGHKNYLFNERFYEYKSLGVIKNDEPLNIYTHWSNYIIDSNREKREEKTREMLARRVPSFKLMNEYIGESFVEEVEGGKRLYNVDELSRTIPHAGNSWFEFLGILAAVFGLAFALLEPRLTKQ